MSPGRHLVDEVVASGVDGEWRDAWSSALQAVELDVDAAEDLLRRLHREEEPAVEGLTGSWTPPRLRGPVPLEFADRARALLQRQLDVGEHLAHALVQARSERRALAKLDPAERPPVFVDKAL